MTEPKKEELHYIARNRKARHDYEIVDTFEAGIELRGSEVKSLREGKINLSDAYATIDAGQVILKHLHITPYKMAMEQLDPTRDRRLLMHRREIRKLEAKIEQQGMTMVPLAVYFKGRRAKIELGLGIGRRKFDKRQAIAKEEAKRTISRAIRREAKRG